MLRVTGKVEFLDDPKLKQKLFEQMPMLKQLDSQANGGIVQIFHIPAGEAYFWTMKDILREREIEHVRFGAVSAKAQ